MQYTYERIGESYEQPKRLGKSQSAQAIEKSDETTDHFPVTGSSGRKTEDDCFRLGTVKIA